MESQTQASAGRSRDVHIVVPDVSRSKTYAAVYHAASLRTLFKRHGLIVAQDPPRFETQYTITTHHKQRWAQTFGVEPLEDDPPFTYYSQAGQLLMIEFLRALGINLKHLLHLGHSMERNVLQSTGAAGTRYRLRAHVASCVALPKGRALVVLQSDLRTLDGVHVASHRETLIIRNVPAKHHAQIAQAFGFAEGEQAIAANAARAGVSFDPDAQLTRSTVYVPSTMGPRYGAVSGDLNPVHTSKVTARVFGFRRPFIQGLCTANYALLELTRLRGPQLGRFEITFARPIYTDQTVDFVCSDRAFAFLDRSGKQLAFGSCEHQPATSDAVVSGQAAQNTVTAGAE